MCLPVLPVWNTLVEGVLFLVLFKLRPVNEGEMKVTRGNCALSRGVDAGDGWIPRVGRWGWLPLLISTFTRQEQRSQSH